VAECKQQYYSVLLVTVFPMMLTNLLFSQIIRGGSCLAKLFSQNISHPFRQADNSCYSNDGGAAAGNRWSASVWNFTAKQKYATQDEIDSKRQIEYHR
jgi:hypothetical protein